MSQVDVSLKSHKMGLEEDFYSFDFDNEEIPVYQNQDEMLAALRQKEEEVILAAQLGNALLLENRQLKRRLTNCTSSTQTNWRSWSKGAMSCRTS